MRGADVLLSIVPPGARFVDAAIIGGPPRDGRPGPRFYASGPDVEAFMRLRAFGLDVRQLADGVGRASALKMSYATLTKGLTASAVEALVAARQSGVGDALASERRDSQPALRQRIDRQLPSMPPKAFRWVSEMEEVAAMFDACGPRSAPAR